ncbi:hypothetical protein FAGAP_1502 [Fusarium agapanthi]|uniref:Ankyrin n=1 Tax=Fusarium agapanthi TaxID=1803897 RepID=A0A9P5BJD2_9HYPO|nr:hypothetical protein FAGAP_1502 [Fusarium agapanthi]
MRLGRRREESLPSSDDTTISDQDNEPHYEYILKEMYVPSLSDNSFAGQKDLVETTWKQEGTTEPWFTKPEFLGRLKDSVRVLSFGYNAHRFGDVANTRIIHHANDLLRNLVLKRLDHPDRPLIFIAHSLGGLVVKRAILLCATNDDWKAIKQATKSIIFMGTPHMGSEKAEDLVVVQKLASLIKLQTAVATNLTKELRAFSNSVQDINMEFTIDVHRSIKLLCCYESHPQRLPNGAKEIIVPQWSAVLQGVDNIDLNCTHSGLPKFASPLHPRFELFWGEVERLVRLVEPPPIKPLKKAPTWTDEDVTQPSPRPRQSAPLKRRHEVGKVSKASRESAIRSSVDKLLKKVTSRINVDVPTQHETAVSQAQSRTQPEKFDVKEFSDFTRLLRSVTPENKGLDREAPHWQTCSWILEDPTFVKWKENKSGSLLFITGSPGCGKSNLAKYIQGAMKDSDDERWEESLVIPFYCDSLESSRHNPPILDLVVQCMLSKYTTISQATRKKLESVLETLGVDRQKSRSPLETENSGYFIQLMEIVQLLVTAEDARPTCLIIDGLDQCEDEFIIRLLRGLDTIFRRESSASALKVVVTSRMADSIRGFALANNHIEVTPDLVLNDIQKVVDEEVDRILLSRRIATVGRASVSAVIVERSNGSFLFASAVLKELWHIKDTGANSVFTLVTSCPPTMEAIYQQDMDRIQNERNDLFQLIQIICIARSTLRIEEAKEILRFLNPSVTRTYDLVGDLTRTCQRLIRFGAEDTLELLHQTLYDFILDTYDSTSYIKPSQPHASNMSTPLILCAIYGHCRSVRALVKAGAKVDAVDPWNQTALFTAVEVGSVDVVRTLLEFGADPNISSINGHSPLALATGKNSSEMVELLLEFSADLDAPAFDGKPIPFLASWMGSTDALEILVQYIDVDQVWRNERLIHMACFKGWKGVVDKLIEKHANINDPPRDLPKASPVALAVESRHSDILRMLLAAGAAVECPVKGMSSPLHIAVTAQNLLGCELLLSAGCQVDAEDKDGSTALSIAADLNDLDMVECLVSHGADPSKPDYETPLHIAVDWRNFEMVEVILSSRFFSNIDEKGEKEYTALGIAATTGRLDIVSMLLDHGADPNMRNGPHNSSAPLHIAANKGHRSIVIELLKRGADPYPETTKEPSAFHTTCIGGWLDVIETFLEVVDDVGELVNFEWGWAGTPLKAAASGGRLDAVKLLLSKGADPNNQLQSKINRGQTIIHAAAEGGNTQVLEAILDAVDDLSLEIRDRAQRTPLWYACVGGHEDMVKFLLERGASTDVIFDDGENIIPIIVSGGSEKNLKLVLEKNPNLDTDCILADGETPLFTAVYSGHSKIVSILLERGADVNRRSKYGNVPVFGAITNRQHETLQILLEHESIDLTQRDSFDRTALQIAQQSGTSLMPAMVLGADKDSDVEKILTENRDIYGLNAYDLTRPEANDSAPFDRCVEGVRQGAQSLLDDSDLHGVRWERLGKFLLQLRSYSFAQIALQRSARAVETAPLVLKHDNYCDMCLDTITGPRYVCCTCCTVDLCEVCVRRDKKPGNRTWTCDYHSFLAIHLPKIQAPDVILRTEIDFHVPSRLSPIEEVASDSSQGWTEADGNEPFREPLSLLDDQDDQDGVSSYSGDTANSHAMAIEPLSTQSSTAVTGYSFDDGELPDRATNNISALAKEEWSDRTEDELREFLEAVLKTFTTYQTPNGISKWNFWVDSWTLRYKDDALKSSWVEGDENVKFIQPVREWTPLQPLTEAYYYLSGLSYLMADVPLYLVATGLEFHGYEDEALKRRKRLQRLHHKVIFAVRRHEEVVV